MRVPFIIRSLMLGFLAAVLILPLLAGALDDRGSRSREDRSQSALTERLCQRLSDLSERPSIVLPDFCTEEPPPPPPAPEPPPPAPEPTPPPPPPPPSPEPTPPPPPPEGAVVITEVMYNPDGGDVGHEWIEVMNGTSEPIDLTDWLFAESAGNHGLALAFGAIIVAPGGFFIIADDAAQFRLDFPDYAQTLFDSSFSLSNTGETIAIKNVAGEIVDEVTYSSAQGGSGDGNSLQRTESGWTAAAPTPGAPAQ